MKYRQLIKGRLIKLEKKGRVNINKQIINDYRGKKQVEWVIINGEREKGLRYNSMEENLDKGEILLKERI